MRKPYTYVCAALFAWFVYAETTGTMLFGPNERAAAPQSIRQTPRGFRSYHRYDGYGGGK